MSQNECPKNRYSRSEGQMNISRENEYLKYHKPQSTRVARGRVPAANARKNRKGALGSVPFRI